jgi:hypothetical protein
MDMTPPAGSQISVVTEGPDSIIVMPHPDHAMVHVTKLFLTIWLLAAAGISLSSASKLLSGNGNWFLVFWTGAWTLGSIFVAHALCRGLRRPVAETLTLKRDGVCYDSGIVPMLLKGREISFPKHVRVDLDRHQLQSLRLRGDVVGQWRLTVDVGADRIDVAPYASGVEREWIARLLANRYSVGQVWAGPNDI